MKQILDQAPTYILRAAILGIGLAVLLTCILGLPAAIAADRSGYYRPILLGLYVPAIPFYIALHQALKLLGYIDHQQVFAARSVSALRNIKTCALVITALFTAGLPYIYYVAQHDDAPGPLLVALIIAFAAFVIATAAGLFQSLLQTAIDIKAENDLTV